jgi:Crp-like helix-turn-helix domain
MISLLAIMQSGEAIETGIIGAEGLLGGDAPINGHLFAHATVQLDGAALTMPKAQFVDAYHAHPHMRDLVNRYQAILLMQARQNAACHALHSVRGRLCRWLLQSQDMIGSATFTLTQEFLSHMLGVRRNTVSVEAHALQEAGLIRYTRGHINIVNRDGLEDCACECYSVIRAETDMGASSARRSEVEVASLAPDGRCFYRLPISHDRQKRDHAALREIRLLDGILLLVQEHALFKDYLFQVGLKEREICRLKRRQQTILAARRGPIVHHTRSLPLEPVELMTAVMGGGAPGQRPTEIKFTIST